MKFLFGIIRTVIAGGVAYGIFYFFSMLPVWLWGWLARPIDLTHISILQIIIIIFIAGLAFSFVSYWFIAIAILPGSFINKVAPQRKWIKVTIASLVSLYIFAEMAFFIILYKTGCVRIGDGTTSVAAELPIGLTIYSSSCGIVAIIGMIAQAIASENDI